MHFVLISISFAIDLFLHLIAASFKFNNLNKKKISIQVFDINGEIVYEKEGLAENNFYSVNLKNLSIGMYLVKLNGEKLSHYSKIFKQ